MELEVIKSKIYEIRGQRVMLDRDLAQMYGVETKVLNQAVRRNLDRFPEDFMFMLTSSECKALEISMRSQFVTSKMGRILTIEQSGKDNAEAIITSNKTRQQAPRIPEYWHHRSSLPAARGAWWGG